MKEIIGFSVRSGADYFFPLLSFIGVFDCLKKFRQSKAALFIIAMSSNPKVNININASNVDREITSSVRYFYPPFGSKPQDRKTVPPLRSVLDGLWHKICIETRIILFETHLQLVAISRLRENQEATGKLHKMNSLLALRMTVERTFPVILKAVLPEKS